MGGVNRRGARWRALAHRRVQLGRSRGEACGLCGQEIDYRLSGRHPRGPTADHVDRLMDGGAMLPPLEDLQVAHRDCNSRDGAKAQNLERTIAKVTAQRGPARTPTPLPALTRAPASQPDPAPGPEAAVEEDLPAPVPWILTKPIEPGVCPDPGYWGQWPWLRPLIEDMPATAVWPRIMTPPLPGTTGTLGWQILEWIEARRRDDPRTPARKKPLRWWQKLVIVRRAEVAPDVEGEESFAAEVLLTTTSRQVGKSVGMAEWSNARIHLLPAIAGEAQLLLQVAKDMPVARQVMKPLRLWAEDRNRAAKATARDGRAFAPTDWRDPYKIRLTQGNEEIEVNADGSVWMIRGKGSAYGYSASDAELDECWALEPSVVDDGIEPTMLAMAYHQLHLTSTAHPRATTLFPGRRDQALAGLPGTLLLEWSADWTWNLDDPHVWRMASPHWDMRRAEFVRRKHSAWRLGQEVETDLEQGGFPAQYLNLWPRVGAGGVETLVQPDVWAAAARPGITLPTTDVTAVVAHDEGMWIVAAAAPVGDQVVVWLAGRFTTDVSRDWALEHLFAGGRGTLLAPSTWYRHVRAIRGGGRRPIGLAEPQMTAAFDLVLPWLTAGRVVHPDDPDLTKAMEVVPRHRSRLHHGVATLAVVAIAEAGKNRRRGSGAA